MWTRAELKTRAKAVLRINYWKAFAISLVLLIAGANYTKNAVNWSNNSGVHNYDVNRLLGDARQLMHGATDIASNAVNQGTDIINSYVYRTDSSNPISRIVGAVPFNRINPFYLLMGFGILLFSIGMVFFRVLVGYGLEIGGRRYFTDAANNPKADMKILGLAFRGGNYLNVIKTMLLRAVYTYLWYLLFIIPGIIKSLSYSMVPYILADNPMTAPGRAIELSERLTNGHKWNIFVLNLSFIGWYMLGGLCFGIGVAFVYPYDNATKAELYLLLRDNAIADGVISCEELGLTPVIDYIDTTVDNI